jgi:hypothetical protein
MMLLAVGGWVLPHTAITPGNAARIEVGMTLQQVEEILGGPARDESTRELDVDECSVGLAQWVHQHCQEMPIAERFSFGRLWVSDGGMIDVHFDADARVKSRRYSELWFKDEYHLDIFDIFDMLDSGSRCRRLGL